VTSSKTTRRIASGIGLLAVTAMLTGCNKPQPKVTVQSGGTSKIVSAQPLCVLANACSADASKVVHLSAATGSQILIDVPKDLSNASWAVTAFTQDQAGKNSPVGIPGTGVPIKGKHTVRLAVPNGTGQYWVQVNALVPTKQLTTWIVSVDITV
jgi:hypothetical protein